MSDPVGRLFFDYVDPVSFLLDREVGRLEAESGVALERFPFELRVPPAPLIDVEEEAWTLRWAAAERLAGSSGVTLSPPALVPWSRKAHELLLHAREVGHEAAVHAALFRAFFGEGLDIGRVDVLVRLALGVGLEKGAVRAVLDVDRHAEGVERMRAEAERQGVRGVPTLLVGGRLLEGVPRPEALRSLLGLASPPADPEQQSRG